MCILNPNAKYYCQQIPEPDGPLFRLMNAIHI